MLTMQQRARVSAFVAQTSSHSHTHSQTHTHTLYCIVYLFIENDGCQNAVIYNKTSFYGLQLYVPDNFFKRYTRIPFV